MTYLKYNRVWTINSRVTRLVFVLQNRISSNGLCVRSYRIYLPCEIFMTMPGEKWKLKEDDGQSGRRNGAKLERRHG